MIEVERFVNSRFTSNTYIISQPEHNDVWVVDPGDTKIVFEWMKNHSKTAITGILLTHAHFDHIYGMNEILSRYPHCVVYIANEYGKNALHNPKTNGSKYTEEGPIEILNGADIQYYPSTLKLWDDVELHSFNTPGHSDDSQCFYIENLLFTGDTLIKDIRTVTKIRGGSVEKLKDTVKLLSEFQGRYFKVMPGHGEEFLLDGYDLNIAVTNSLYYFS